MQRRTLVIVIILLTVATRFYHLTYQSLWFDELYSVTIAAPDNSVQGILTDIKTDFHPPLFYFLLHYVFRVFPYNDLTGRLLSAIIGCIGVWLIYLLAKQSGRERFALLTALFCSVFFFHVKYSQEVRMYIVLFCLATITSLLFLKYLRSKRNRHLWLYAVVSAIMLYTHYYGFFIMVAQAICLLHLFVVKKIPATLFRNFILAFAGAGILYLPWIPMIFHTGGREHFMNIPAAWYFFEYLYDYTGKEPVTTLFMLTGMVLYIRKAIGAFRRSGWVQSPFQLLMFYSVVSVFVLIYAVSLFKPVLNKQGTLAGLPFLIILVLTGLESLKDKWVNRALAVAVIAGIINLLFISGYYRKQYKENFRQITELIIENTKGEPNVLIVSQLSKFYNYYLQQMGSGLKAVNPNQVQPRDTDKLPENIIALNAPFTEEKEQRLESINRLGFQILNPRLLHKIDSIDHYNREWNSFLTKNYTIDTSYNHPTRDIAVAFKFKKLQQ